jgi:WRKY transcription factor 2
MTNVVRITWHLFQLREISGMAGASNHGSLIDEWLPPPTPSPRTLMSSFLNEEFSSEPFSGFFSEHGTNKPHDQSEKSREVVNSSEEVPAHAVSDPFQKGFSLKPNLFSANHKSNSNGGLAERRAARAGFSVAKIDTSRVGSSAVIRSPVSIPPGLSPTTLLESPVFLYNKMVCDISLIGFLCSQDLSVTLLSKVEIKS